MYETLWIEPHVIQKFNIFQNFFSQTFLESESLKIRRVFDHMITVDSTVEKFVQRAIPEVTKQ